MNQKYCTQRYSIVIPPQLIRNQFPGDESQEYERIRKTRYDYDIADDLRTLLWLGNVFADVILCDYKGN